MDSIAEKSTAEKSTADELRQQFQVAAQAYAENPFLQRRWAESLTMSELAQIAEGEYSTRVVVHDALGAWSYDAPNSGFTELRAVCREVHGQRMQLWTEG